MINQYINIIQSTPVLHVVIGAFDGVHYAHQELISHAQHQAKKHNQALLIFSFSPLPKEYFLGKEFSGKLLPNHIRQSLLEQFKSDYTIIADFEEIYSISEKEFIESLLQKTDHIILYSGNDFRLGSLNGEKYEGSKVTRIFIDDITINKDICRSSNVRELLLLGKVERANILLNKEYCIYSETVRGDQIGRTIDFPTINILPSDQTIPKNGVYFGEITIFNEIYPAAIYIGKRPTVRGLTLRIESHIISNFTHKEIPERTPACVTFIERIAEEKSFKSLEELQKMLYNYKDISLGLATKRYDK